MPDLLKRVMTVATQRLDYQVYQDALMLLTNKLKNVNRDLEKDIVREAVDNAKTLCEILNDEVPKVSDLDDMRRFYRLHRELLKLISPYDFDSFCIFLEWNRDPERKFYLPRRKQLKPLAEAMQRLYDDELDLLCISLAPGVGKTTLAEFFIIWWGGNDCINPILVGSHSNSFLEGMYGEVLRIMDKNGEYLYHEVFPQSLVVHTNAKNMMIDLGVVQRFSTLEFTSVGSGNAGRVRCKNLLYCDDLVSGIEEAMSKERLDSLWDKYTTDLRQRKLGNKCKELHIATRWSLYDPIGRLEDAYGNDERALFIKEPVLDENDESRFDYPYGLGHTTEAMHRQREMMDDASWRALYMNEPIEREGQLFAPMEVRRYFELPDREPDAIVAVCDTKDRGTDFCVQPVGYIYGDDIYIDNVVCDDGKPEVVEERLAQALKLNKVQMARYESNSAGGKIAEKVQARVKELEGITKITTKYTTANKETKIIVNSPYIKEHFLFKDDTVIGHDKEYRNFLKFLFSYTLKGKNKHDDVPDALSQLSEFIQSMAAREVTVFRRPF